MNWAMLPGIGNRIGTAAAVGALVAVSALSVPAAAFAAPPRPEDPDCAIDVGNPACAFGAPFEAPNVPTGPDDPRCVGSPLSVGCEGGPFDEDPIYSEWPRLPGEPISLRGPYDPGQPAAAPPNDGPPPPAAFPIDSPPQPVDPLPPTGGIGPGAGDGGIPGINTGADDTPVGPATAALSPEAV